MALIKCPECKKEISDTVKKCPNCGFSLRENKFMKFFNKNKRICIIGGGIFALIILITIIINAFPSDSKKMVKYLEKSNFKCEKAYIEEDVRIKKVCTKGNNVKEIFYIYEDNHFSYKVQNGSYHYTIHDTIYIEGTKHSQQSIIMTDDELTCRYQPDDGSFVYGKEYDTTSTDMICIKYIDKVNQSLRDFEKYFENAGIKLGR